MTAYPEFLNTDGNNVETSAEYHDSRWKLWTRRRDGDDVTQGAIADAAVTDPSSSGSVVALLKGILTFLRVSAAGVGKAEDAAHASGDTGVMALAVRKDTAAVSSSASGDYEPLSTDQLGRLRTRADLELSNARTTALATNLVVKASAGRLYGFQGYSTTAGFLQLHNTTTLPADTAVPVEVIPVTAGDPFSVDFGVHGVQFSTGIVACFSTTGPTKTLGGSAIWLSAQYV